MNARRDPDRLVHAFLMEGQTELADQVYDAVRAAIEQKRQRAVIGPWRMPTMNKFVPIGLGAAAVVVALVVGTQLLAAPAPGGVGTAPSVQPSPTPSPTPSTSPSASPAASPPPLTETFTSQMHGISVSYPEGWTARAATEPWTGCLYCTLVLSHPQIDVLLHPVHDDGLFLRIASQPIGESAPEDWVAATDGGRRSLLDNRADQRRRRHWAQRRRDLSRGGRHNRRPRLPHRPLGVTRRPGPRRSVRQGVVRGGPRDGPAPARGCRRSGAVRDAVAGPPSTTSTARSPDFGPRS